MEKAFKLKGLIASAFLALFLLSGCQHDIPVPERLIGVWTTDSPGYEDRYLEFAPDFLTFGVGNSEEISHHIRKVTAEKGKNRTLYVFHYQDQAGGLSTLRLVYVADSGGSIRFVNREEVWKLSDGKEM